MGADVPTTISPGLLLARDMESRGVPSCYLAHARVAYCGTGQVPDGLFHTVTTITDSTRVP